MSTSNVKPMPAPVSQRRKFSLGDMKRGKLDVPRRILGYGGEKVGKSTWASGAPGARFLCPENGTAHLDIVRLPTPECWEEVFDVLELAASDPDCQTVVIDPINWLEDLCWARVVNGPNSRWDESTRDKIEKHGGGFGKGYSAAVGHWRTLIKELESKHYSKGRHVIFLAHSLVKKFSDPSGVEYDRYYVHMHDKSAGLLKQWVDDVLFFRHEVLAKQEGAKTLALATGARVVHTEWSKAWDAGNRSSLPEELPMSWDAYWDAVAAGRKKLEALRVSIDELLSKLNDTELTKKVGAAVSEAKDNLDKLTRYEADLRRRLGNA